MPRSPGTRLKPAKYIPVATAAALLVGSSTLFFVFTCPWLTRAVSPAVPVYNGIIFLFVLANFSMATFMDPGVFPRADEDEDKEDDFRAPLYKNVDVRGIQDFDHHCPWVNNCIGRRNYRYFFLFLLSLSAHMVGVVAFGLVYVLNHAEGLGAAHTTITMAVMCVAGLFFIPVIGLTGFHVVLVTRGRTTNEQVTGKFRGGVNPFTRGCYGNVEHVLCSPLAPRYVVESPRLPLATRLKPPFLRPELLERSAPLKVKLSDNGLKASLAHSKSKGSLDRLDEKPLDLGPPLPPKAEASTFISDLQTPRPGSAESALSAQRTNPPTPAMYKFRPTFPTGPKAPFCGPGEQVPDSLTLGEESIHSLDFVSEPSLDLSDYPPGNLHVAYPPSPPLSAAGTFSGALRSLSLKATGQRGRDHVALQPLHSEGGPPTPHRSIFAPHALPNRNGSLSYDSLLNPGSPGGHMCPAHPSAGMASYHSPYLHPGAVGDLPRPPTCSFSPVLGPRPREPSPVRYDNLSRTIMASIQERKDREERERLLRSQADSLFGDSGIYDAPSSYSLQQANMLSEGPRGPVLRYGSREDLVAGPGFGGARNPALQTSLSSLSSVVSRAPRTSSSSLQADLANNNAPGPRPSSGSHRSPVHQGPPSPPGTPCSPSYAGPKAVAFIHTDLPEPPPLLAVQRGRISTCSHGWGLRGQPRVTPSLHLCHLGLPEDRLSLRVPWSPAVGVPPHGAVCHLHSAGSHLFPSLLGPEPDAK
ncbi:PREDICTED: probable palmitoyltransferase ZDHHC8 isoform X3 [Condylura cristata]|uniref:probable palmitoyltransferase ZDHHC8 isoform X3 n=1 Tax=Condylura cristata TaxID=143302 RepID=UPI000643B792|nr:PREDICTED: probable palmitoyltransferase ZDHHC8 isoform X3 [Condylura cristata]